METAKGHNKGTAIFKIASFIYANKGKVIDDEIVANLEDLLWNELYTNFKHSNYIAIPPSIYESNVKSVYKADMEQCK